MSKMHQEPTFLNRVRWNDRELLDFATGIQKYGASETAKIARLIGTKNEDQVKVYIHDKLYVLKKKYLAEKRKKDPNLNFTNIAKPLPEEIKNWPPIRKWNKIAKNQMMFKKMDYSTLIMHNAFQDFYEEAEATTSSQIVDVKAIYKYLLDCISGKNPAELMPKESGVVLMLLKKLKEMKSAFDLDEENKFILSYKEATNFLPFEEKGKEKDKTKKDKASEDDSNAVRIPEDLYTLLNEHRRIVQSMNPLMVPLWLLAKEQNYLFQAMQSTTQHDKKCQ